VEGTHDHLEGRVLDFSEEIVREAENPSQAREFVQVTNGGLGFRFSPELLGETTRNGRKLVNLKGDDSVFAVIQVTKPLLFVLSSSGKAILFNLEEVAKLSGAGAGVRLMKLDKGESVLGMKNVGKNDSLTVVYLTGKDDRMNLKSYSVQARGGVGRNLGTRRKKASGIV